MAIFQRIADILNANINDLLDKAEDPEKMVKQLILEMEEQVDGATQALGQAMGSQKLAEKQLENAKDDAKEWEEKAEVALKAGNEALAKKALDSKVGIDEQVSGLQENYDSLSKQVETLKSNVETLKSKLEEARSRQNVLIARSKVADASAEAASAIGSFDTDSAFSKLDKMEEQVAMKEATAEAYGEMSGLNIDYTEGDEFEKLQHEDAVNTQLAALKDKLGL